MNGIKMEKKKKRGKVNRKEKESIDIPISYNEENSEPEPDNAKETELAETDQKTEYLDQLQRLQAEFANYRNRVNKERENLFHIAKGELISILIPVLDDLDRMIHYHKESDHQCSVEAVDLIYQKLLKVLTDEGLEEIDSVGKPFDPECHEAVGIEETDKKNEDIVLDEWQKGYRFNGRLIRPSRVKVGKHREEKQEPEK